MRIGRALYRFFSLGCRIFLFYLHLKVFLVKISLHNLYNGNLRSGIVILHNVGILHHRARLMYPFHVKLVGSLNIVRLQNKGASRPKAPAAQKSAVHQFLLIFDNLLHKKWGGLVTRIKSVKLNTPVDALQVSMMDKFLSC